MKSDEDATDKKKISKSYGKEAIALIKIEEDKQITRKRKKQIEMFLTRKDRMSLQVKSDHFETPRRRLLTEAKCGVDKFRKSTENLCPGDLARVM